MTGIPSIVAGLFILSFWVLIVSPHFNDGQPEFSGFAASLALSVLMLPTVTRSSEEMLRLVPDLAARGRVRARHPEVEDDPQDRAADRGRPASSPASCSRSRAPPARPRRSCWSRVRTDSINTNPFTGNQESLATYIYSQASLASPYGAPRAWTAALTLVVDRAGPHDRREAARPPQQAQVITMIAQDTTTARNMEATRDMTMAKRIEAENISAYYGSFKAIDAITMTIEPKSVTALIGPSGCGKSTFLRSINRMHEVLPGARVEGNLTIDGQDIYDRDVDVTAVRRMIGMVFQRPNPFPTMSIYDNVVAGLRLGGLRKKSALDDAVREGAAGGEPVERGAHAPVPAGRRPLRRSAAAAVHRPHDRGRAAGRADGRAVLGARPDLDARDRGPDHRAEDAVHDRDRHAQHAAGGARVRPDRVLLDRQDRRPGPSHRVRRHRADLHQPVGEARPRTTSPAASARPNPRARSFAGLDAPQTVALCWSSGSGTAPRPFLPAAALAPIMNLCAFSTACRAANFMIGPRSRR